jgi:glyoxylate utilization-related uncharacterized protein
MSRPHIEFIQEQDRPWQNAAPAAGLSGFQWKILSQADNHGAQTALVRFDSGWRSAPGLALPAAQEFFLLEGALSAVCGNQTCALSPGGYLRIAPGTPFGPLRASAETRTLWMTDGRLDPIPPSPPTPESVTFTDSTALEWQIPWVKGPAPGLRLKLLWRDEKSGAYSRLLSVDPGWSEPRLEHHDCSEEAFVIAGDMTMGSLGTMRPGAYFWRPPGIKHGPMHSSSGALILIRTDGALFNYYTAADGTPLNYTA